MTHLASRLASSIDRVGVAACALVAATVAAACSGGSSGGGVDAPTTIDAPVTDGDPAAIDAPIDGDPAAIDAPGPSDGGGDGAPATDPGAPGTYQAAVTATVQIPLAGGATLGATVCTPMTDGSVPVPAPFPLVVISPGFQLARAQYRIYCEHLATWGYVAIARDYGASGNHQAKAAEVGRVIDWALGPASGLAGRIDATRIGVAGHSLGGKVSINAAILDPRIRAVVGWDPVDALPPFGNDGSTSVTPELMANLRVPLAVLGETGDSTGGLGGMSCAPAADNYAQFYRTACQAPAALEVTIAMADHMDWIGDRATCGLACFACSNGQTPDATVRTITQRVTTAWFQQHLRGDTTMAPWLTAPGIGSPTALRTGVPTCP